MFLENSAIQIVCSYLANTETIRASIFGSYARGEAKQSSDLDLLVEFEPSIILFYQRVVMSTFRGSGMDDDSFQIVRSRLVAGTEISVKIENLLKY